MTIYLIVLAIFLALSFYYMLSMPGKSTVDINKIDEKHLQDIQSFISKKLEVLSKQIGSRNVIEYEGLNQTEQFITQELESFGYAVKKQEYRIQDKVVHNIIAEVKGQQESFYIIGAHYDTVYSCPGANDNGSGVVALLSLAQKFQSLNLKHGVRFVFFVNEEPPYFQTENMGSLVYAKSLQSEKKNILGMISLEMLGSYYPEANTQKYPFPFNFFYPDTANFIGFVSNLTSKKFMARALSAFRETHIYPSEGAAMPTLFPGVSWSDQWSFWKIGVPSFMITDTAFYRYDYYHTPEDTIDKINFPDMAKVVLGVQGMLESLCRN